ncbi:hypothetical protein CXG45_08025 [Pseudomonas plecoglossicida]|uniref:Secreted protein n=1 Tax=Pseudomonas plecoglossicida TaxID=70775 RepID=A0ABX4U4U3_PSEDL|nr:hypothetical protein CXG44_16085 [Pseudomonas plecoglossicida]PLU94112.1 hypothetical protein CXG45_08025 [Pseudomonas plecoglossicida]PLV04953.1 hypothetical protein CXG48_07885 [Pseudomonas plecoglossicida]PLV14226.1 hypothetical protein CXG47_12585 [Pseudomonas plecoglossicida]
MWLFRVNVYYGAIFIVVMEFLAVNCCADCLENGGKNSFFLGRLYSYADSVHAPVHISRLNDLSLYS